MGENITNHNKGIDTQSKFLKIPTTITKNKQIKKWAEHLDIPTSKKIYK